MADMEALFRAVDELSPDELDRLKGYVVQREETILGEPDDRDVEEQIAGLRAALAEFREGLTESELRELVAAMNVNYVYPMKDLAMYDYIEHQEQTPKRRLTDEDIADLRAALAEFREGFTEDEWDKIAADMNRE